MLWQTGTVTGQEDTISTATRQEGMTTIPSTTATTGTTITTVRQTDRLIQTATWEAVLMAAASEAAAIAAVHAVPEASEDVAEDADNGIGFLKHYKKNNIKRTDI